MCPTCVTFAYRRKSASGFNISVFSTGGSLRPPSNKKHTRAAMRGRLRCNNWQLLEASSAGCRPIICSTWTHAFSVTVCHMQYDTATR